MPNVIDDLSLKIRLGQYVAIVGKTGCRKSTLMCLMLGFEKVRKGAIYYDRIDIDKLDLKSLRQKIGSVMQDGKMFQDDIFSNISITCLALTLDEAWEAVGMAGMADDVCAMPMAVRWSARERRHIRRTTAAATNRPCNHCSAEGPHV